MPLFRSSPKSPQELVKNLDEALKVMRGAEGGGKKAEKASMASIGCVSLILLFVLKWVGKILNQYCHAHFMNFLFAPDIAIIEP